MQLIIYEEIAKLQPKGLLTIPKKFREKLGFSENNLVRLKADRGRLIVEPVKTLPYPVRTYSDQELKEFFALDDEESKKLKAKGLL
ncbi:MAG: hypothetical protein UV54_C0035G0009 [Candidatus Beckwithbacteria bacterium GW2011_GWA2_43_10]|uniref:SpoVT-AbrB domain-containing protein n=1 Tax=Candidatus Beckwithbacteria bacterium GW2011_GWA2_43_10 TaxID=1618369 RepID=A0A0G1EXQ6_9BACT|nr:MAG: hypothetical protein UV54_C0035G0009 [Candidatus Beckwithbacteria bacterium GW2011_GWA2_43_10]